MATKPTRHQESACDKLAEAIRLIAEASRLDGKSRLDAPAFAALAELLGRASSAFPLDAIVDRALDARGKALGLRSGTTEMLTLLDPEIRPLDVLLSTDEELRALVTKLDEELGEV